MHSPTPPLPYRKFLLKLAKKLKIGDTTQNRGVVVIIDIYMKIVYIAGKYRAKTIYQINKNIQLAEDVALKYWKKGYAVICPHKNTSFLDGSLPDDVWLNGDLEILRRCDVIVMMRDWQDSKGAVEELKLAKKLGLKVIYE